MVQAKLVGSIAVEAEPNVLHGLSSLKRQKSYTFISIVIVTTTIWMSHLHHPMSTNLRIFIIKFFFFYYLQTFYDFDT